MFSAEPFYHQTTKRVVTAFGTLFNNIRVIREDRDGNEQNRFKVPLAYHHKKAWHRIGQEYSDRNEDVSTVQGYFPRMSFNIVDFTPLRESQYQTPTYIFEEAAGGGVNRTFLRSRYRITIELTIVAKKQEDLYQIVEQIIPYFTPSVAVSFKSSRLSTTLDDDLIFTLSDISEDDELELSISEAYNLQLVTRYLTFTTEVSFYGPTEAASGVIKTVNVDFIDGATGKPMSKVSISVDPSDAESSSFGISEGVFLLDDDFNLITSATLGATGLLC